MGIIFNNANIIIARFLLCQCGIFKGWLAALVNS